MSDEQYTLYCDEAGSTGIDLTGTDQPFFIAAGYLIPHSQEEDLKDVVRALLATVSKERGVQLAELKSSSLVGSARGRNHLAGLLRGVEARGGVPLLIAIEKRFSLGGRFVDDFLDLDDNPRAGPEFCVDRQTKRAAATAIGESSDATLKAIENSLRNPTRDSRRAAVLAVVQDLRTRGHHGLAHITEGILLSPDGLDPQAASDLSFPDFTASNTPNPTSLNALLVAADQYGAHNNISRIDLVHDETKYMEEALTHAYWLATDPEVHQRLSDTPYLEVYPRVERVQPPRFVTSVSEPLVQAADLLAGGVAHWMKRGYRGEHLDPSSRLIAEATITIFMDGYMPGAGAVFSDTTAWLSGVARQLEKGKMRVPLRGPILE